MQSAFLPGQTDGQTKWRRRTRNGSGFFSDPINSLHRVSVRAPNSFSPVLLELPISLSCTIIIWGLLASLHLYDKDVDQLLPARPFLSLLQSCTADPTTYNAHVSVYVRSVDTTYDELSIGRTSAADREKQRAISLNASHDPTLSELS